MHIVHMNATFDKVALDCDYVLIPKGTHLMCASFEHWCSSVEGEDNIQNTYTGQLIVFLSSKVHTHWAARSLISQKQKVPFC